MSGLSSGVFHRALEAELRFKLKSLPHGLEVINSAFVLLLLKSDDFLVCALTGCVYYLLVEIS